MKVALALFGLIAAVSACSDNNRSCPNWKRYCGSNSYVKANCKKTCGTCSGGGGGGGGTLPDQSQCGIPEVRNVRVIGGKNSARGSWPWQILMMKNGRAGCGGTLISSRWVVTAAHCVDRSEHNPRSFSVRVGEYDRRRSEGSEVDIQVEKVVKHPAYNGRNLQNDIALFKLSRPVQFNKWVKPACLPSRDPAPGTECYITGWGKMRHPGSMTMGPLQQALLPVVSNSVCHAKNSRSIGISVTRDMICGGDGGRTIKSGCHGDSGGPYVCNIGGKWELHGDVSHGSSRCSSSDSYTVFARTMYFKQWIAQQIQRYGN